MAPMKFEEHVKEKLDGREIKPSAGSWDKLNSRLNKAEKKSDRKWWFSAAAAVLAILVSSLLFVNQQSDISAPIADNPADIEVQKKPQSNEVTKPVQVASEENMEKKSSASDPSKIIKSKRNNSESAIAESNRFENNQRSQSVQSDPVKKREILEPVVFEPIPLAESENDRFVNKVQEVLDIMAKGEKIAEDYTEAEVDALLAQAASELSKERILDHEGVVSADALLADVEFEVDQSFRQEVFDFLKEEFLKAKTAVATRND
ncbi:hypothetical protein ML462_12645 [Gramella lutea]|uniref:Uncharacterized protein n=1 Tax=Christiangramia lutea TaxID=1607951 RepID=A0A9X2AA45_9FLAO|nr:hypothetical protein [Christiangramia lutea]MCH4824020.1 hypothetical protein [Christiangramia lutea]